MRNEARTAGTGFASGGLNPKKSRQAAQHESLYFYSGSADPTGPISNCCEG